MSDTYGFLPEDYRYTAELLRRHAFGTTEAAAGLFRAVCSNNLSIILAALDRAGTETAPPPFNAGTEAAMAAAEHLRVAAEALHKQADEYEAAAKGRP